MLTTISQWLDDTTTILKKTSTTPRLDAEILLCDEIDVTRAWLIAHPDVSVITMSEVSLRRKVARRSAGEPLAYIRGTQEFYGRPFSVNKNVLVPRPESESMIELIVKHCKVRENLRIADVGSGSGCLGITMALELKTPFVDLYDNDESTFVVSRRNCRLYKTLRPNFYLSDLLTDYHGPYDIILANLPYVPENYPINISATFEPRNALFVPGDGLELYRQLFNLLRQREEQPMYVVVECLEQQQPLLDSIALDKNYHLLDSYGLARVYTPKK